MKIQEDDEGNRRVEIVELPMCTVTIRSNDKPIPEQASKQWLLTSESLRGHLFCFHWNYETQRLRQLHEVGGCRCRQIDENES